MNALADLLSLPAADSADVRGLVADHAELVSLHDRIAARMTAMDLRDKRYLHAFEAARRQVERAAVRHVRAVMAGRA